VNINGKDIENNCYDIKNPCKSISSALAIPLSNQNVIEEIHILVIKTAFIGITTFDNATILCSVYSERNALLNVTEEDKMTVKNNVGFFSSLLFLFSFYFQFFPLPTYLYN
jgi:hypothetical protein